MMAKSPVESSRENSREICNFQSFALLASGLLRYIVQLALIPFYLFLGCVTAGEIPLHVLTNGQTCP